MNDADDTGDLLSAAFGDEWSDADDDDVDDDVVDGTGGADADDEGAELYTPGPELRAVPTRPEVQRVAVRGWSVPIVDSDRTFEGPFDQTAGDGSPLVGVFKYLDVTVGQGRTQRQRSLVDMGRATLHEADLLAAHGPGEYMVALRSPQGRFIASRSFWLGQPTRSAVGGGPLLGLSARRSVPSSAPHQNAVLEAVLKRLDSMESRFSAPPSERPASPEPPAAPPRQLSLLDQLEAEQQELAARQERWQRIRERMGPTDDDAPQQDEPDFFDGVTDTLGNVAGNVIRAKKTFSDMALVFGTRH
jgi:hypothetical protein